MNFSHEFRRLASNLDSRHSGDGIFIFSKPTKTQSAGQLQFVGESRRHERKLR